MCLCWELAVAPQSLFVGGEACHLHFLELISSFVEKEEERVDEEEEDIKAEKEKDVEEKAAAAALCSGFRDHLRSLSLLFHREMKSDETECDGGGEEEGGSGGHGHGEEVGEGELDGDGEEVGEVVDVRPLLHFLRLQVLHHQASTSSTAPAGSVAGAGGTNPQSSTIDLTTTDPLAAPVSTSDHDQVFPPPSSSSSASLSVMPWPDADMELLARGLQLGTGKGLMVTGSDEVRDE